MHFKRSGAASSPPEAIPMVPKDNSKRQSGVGFTRLPVPVLLAILRSCGPADVWALQQTCKKLRVVAQSADVILVTAFCTLMQARAVHPSNLPDVASPKDDLWAAKQPIRFNSMISGESSWQWRSRSLNPGKALSISGVALVPGGRWLITRGAVSLHLWDLGYGPKPQLNPKAVAEFDLNPSANLDATVSCDLHNYSVPLLLDQTFESGTRIFVPHAPNSVARAHVVSLDLSGERPKFTLLSTLHASDVPPFPNSFTFQGSLVVVEQDTNFTLWNWRDDTWITFTEDNFFEKPPCPLHTAFLIRIEGKYLCVVTGGEYKVYEIPKLRPRRPRKKPEFLTIQPLWNVRLPLAFDANPLAGCISEDSWSATRSNPIPKVLTLSLIYETEVLLYRLPSLPEQSTGTVASLGSPVLLNRRKVDHVEVDKITVTGGATPQHAWNIFPRSDSLWLMTGNLGSREAQNLSKQNASRMLEDPQFREIWRLPQSGGTSPQITVCPISGRIVALNGRGEPLNVFDLNRPLLKSS